MDDSLIEGQGKWSTSLWTSECKDCRAEREAKHRLQQPSGRAADRSTRPKKFEYSSRWASRKLDRGESRSDRCERHRREHTKAIQALAVPYVDLRVIGEVPNPDKPTGPLGGLGPLPVVHTEKTSQVTNDRFAFGMGDAEILQLLTGLTEKQVAVVVAGTGTGKSTFMPFRLMTPPAGAPLKLTDFGPIVVTEPRRAAAIGVARYVGEELCLGHDSRSCGRHIGPGYPVGYQVSKDKCWDSACDLIYATDGSVINWIRDGQLARIGTVIVDEAHERNENIDIILTLLREQVRHHRHLKIIITSATLDEAFFVKFFGEENVFQLSIPAKKSFGYGVPLFIGTKIDEPIIKAGMQLQTAPNPIVFEGWSVEGPTGPDGKPEDLQAETRELVKLRCLDKEIPIETWKKQEAMPQAVVNQVVAIAKGTSHGDILAFLPTNRVIGWCVKQIADHLAGLPFDVYPLLSTTPKETSDKALAARGRGQRRKIVVSSNLAETSLTVKGVRYVVDSGLICEEEWDPQIASGSLPTKPHSQSGLRQRWGRVGRDAPGWVFPLYSAEQFLSLPKNTPPESTRTNLEEFYLKLVAAGADISEAVVPGSFVADDNALDPDARHHVGVFTTESDRVRRVLQLTGTMDRDGDLTSFGRELERYPGDGADALALMLADQLACVHEVALALTVLKNGRLVGSKKDCILRWHKDWPTAWRVRAAQCHKGLATGCLDDLDVLLRIFWLWRSVPSDEKVEWCKCWWINEAALTAAWGEVMSTIDSFSAAMKSEADRPIEPRLGMRARAVLSHSMVSARYRRVAGDIYQAELSQNPEDAILGVGRLVEPLDRILAFHRFRMESTGSEVREPFISHTVAMLDWAEYAGTEPEAMAFELIRLIAANQQQGTAERERNIASLLAAFPIGLVIASSGETADASGQVGIVGVPYLSPDWEQGPQDEAGDDPGYDREWSPYASPAEHQAEDEATTLTVLKSSEQNDEPVSESPASEASQTDKWFDSTIFERVALVEHLPEPAAKKGRKRKSPKPDLPKRGVIVGYQPRENGDWALIVDLIQENSSSDPLAQPPTKAGQLIECLVVGRVPNHDGGAIQFNRMDELGRLYVDIRQNPGLEVFDRTFLARLMPGSTVTGCVVADGDTGLSLTLLPAARAHLALGPTITRSSSHGIAAFHPAVVVAPPDKRGNVVAELEHADTQTGMTHRFSLRKAQLERAGITSFEVGVKVHVALQPDRTERRSSLMLRSPSVRDFAKAQEEFLTIDGDLVRPTSAHLPVSMIAGLIDAGVKPADAWEFFNASFRMKVEAALANRPFATISVPAPLFSLFYQRRNEFQQRWEVEIIIRPAHGVVEVVADSWEKVSAAKTVIGSLSQSPRMSAQSMELIPERALRESVEARAGIDYVWIDKHTNVVSVAGTTRSVIEIALRDLIRPVVGTLTLGIGRSGKPVGNGIVINELCAAAGCHGQRSPDGLTWTIRGPTQASLTTFFSLASTRIYGCSGIITKVDALQLLEEQQSATHSEPQNAKTTSRARGKAEQAMSAAREVKPGSVEITSRPTAKKTKPSAKRGTQSPPQQAESEELVDLFSAILSLFSKKS